MQLIPPNLPLPADSESGQCWRTIGVLGGDRSCPELVQHVHCRNCPVHAEAGAKLLDRPLPHGYRQHWARRLAVRKAEAATGKTSAVIFRAGGEWLALPTHVFLEVAERRVIRSLPHQRSNSVLGLVNIRGELLICLSLERLCGLAETTASPAGPAAHGRILVTLWHGFRQAFPVEEVAGLIRFQPQAIKESPTFLSAPGGAQTRGLLDWNDRVVTLLNEELLFKTINLNFA